MEQGHDRNGDHGHRHEAGHRHDKERPTLQEDLLKELQALSVATPRAVIEEFDLLAINDDAENLPREIAKKVKERIESYVHLLEDLLQPDTNLATLNECGFFTEEQLQGVVKGYRQLMSLIRSHTAADLEATEESYRAFITAALAKWDEMKPLLRATARRLHDGWKEDQPLQREHGYFG